MFHPTNSNKYRTLLIDFIIKRLDMINIPNKIKAFLIKSLHFHAPVGGFLFMIMTRFRLAVIIYMSFIISFILFIYFRGCFLTIIEYKLDNDNFINIVDPYLHLNGMEITDENRYYITMYIAIIYIVVSSWLLLYKYYYHY